MPATAARRKRLGFNARMKNKTLSTWLAFAGGPLGLHRFYLHGLSDTLGWAMPIPTALGIYGIQRMQQFGMDDVMSWVLIPLLGFTMAVAAWSTGCGAGPPPSRTASRPDSTSGNASSA